MVAVAGLLISGSAIFVSMGARHDARRRDRGARLADGAAGDARAARRPGRPRPVPFTASRRGASAGQRRVGRGRRRRHAAPGRGARDRGLHARRARRAGARHEHRRLRERLAAAPTLPVVAAQDAIERAFPGAPSTAQLVVTGRRSAARRRARARGLGERGARAVGGNAAVGVEVARDGRTAMVSVPMSADGVEAQRDAVEPLRDARRADRAGRRALVTGEAAALGRLHRRACGPRPRS